MTKDEIPTPEEQLGMEQRMARLERENFFLQKQLDKQFWIMAVVTVITWASLRALRKDVNLLDDNHIPNRAAYEYYLKGGR